MAKTPSQIEMFATSLRIPVPDADWARAERGQVTGSFNSSICEAVADARTLFQLPSIIREELERDMEAFGKEWTRDYVIHLLTLRYQALIRGDVAPGEGWGAPPKTAAKPKK